PLLEEGQKAQQGMGVDHVLARVGVCHRCSRCQVERTTWVRAVAHAQGLVRRAVPDNPAGFAGPGGPRPGGGGLQPPERACMMVSSSLGVTRVSRSRTASSLTKTFMCGRILPCSSTIRKRMPGNRRTRTEMTTPTVSPVTTTTFYSSVQHQTG